RVPRRFLPGIQVVEYLRAFLFGRLGWNRLGGSLVISGAFGLFRKEYLHAIGGYRVASVVEELDLVWRLYRHLQQRRITYQPPCRAGRPRRPPAVALCGVGWRCGEALRLRGGVCGVLIRGRGRRDRGGVPARRTARRGARRVLVGGGGVTIRAAPARMPIGRT